MFYGYRVLAPMHPWPHMDVPGSHWLTPRFEPKIARARVVSLDFRAPVPLDVDRSLTVRPGASGSATALRISGRACLADDRWLGATNAFHGDKVISIAPLALQAGRALQVRIAYTHGSGLASLRFTTG